MSWNIEDVQKGDYMRFKIPTRSSDGSRGSVSVYGYVKETRERQQAVILENGWLIHTKTELIEHRKGGRK
jgi:hypothetical protein